MGEASKKVPLGILRSPVLQPGPLPDFEGPGRVRAESFGSSGASSPPEQVLPGSRTNWKTVKTTIFVRNQIFALKGVIGFRNLLLASSFFWWILKWVRVFVCCGLWVSSQPVFVVPTRVNDELRTAFLRRKSGPSPQELKQLKQRRGLEAFGNANRVSGRIREIESECLEHFSLSFGFSVSLPPPTTLTNWNQPPAERGLRRCVDHKMATQCSAPALVALCGLWGVKQQRTVRWALFFFRDIWKNINMTPSIRTILIHFANFSPNFEK